MDEIVQEKISMLCIPATRHTRGFASLGKKRTKATTPTSNRAPTEESYADVTVKLKRNTDLDSEKLMVACGGISIFEPV
jgi:hypothetical protein